MLGTGAAGADAGSRLPLRVPHNSMVPFGIARPINERALRLAMRRYSRDILLAPWAMAGNARPFLSAQQSRHGHHGRRRRMGDDTPRYATFSTPERHVRARARRAGRARYFLPRAHAQVVGII